MSGPSYVTRIAPSPTGMMHLGTARTAYFNYLAAKASGGKFIIRCDDTDVQRNKKEYTDIIFQSMEWLGLEPDQVEYQSKRTKLYTGEADDLLRKGKAVELDNGAIALLCPYDLPKLFIDSIAGNIAITDTNKEQIDKKVILLRGEDKENKDKYHTPTYQFASTVDDYFMGVNYIIRGVDHISNTPKQLAIWHQLNSIYGNIQCPKPFPKVAHLGLIMYNGKKLSKRDGAASLLWYKEQGYKPEAMLDWMLRLGWAQSIPRGLDNKEANKKAAEFLSKENAIKLFFDGRMKSNPCNYDLAKLDAINKGHRP